MKPNKDEIQIEAMFACPMVDGEVICERTTKFMVDGRKVTVFRHNPDTGKEEAKEFDIGAVKLSGLPAGHFDSKRAEPADLETELIALLGEGQLKEIGEQFAEIVRQHDLQKSHDICKKLFRYVSKVIVGWNSV